MEEKPPHRLFEELESAVLANRTARDAHPDSPTLFMDSEIRLHAALAAISEVPADPAPFYAAIAPRAFSAAANAASSAGEGGGAADEGTVAATAVALLGHENDDVAAAAAAALAAWLEPSALLEVGAAAAEATALRLAREGLLGCLAEAMARFEGAGSAAGKDAGENKGGDGKAKGVAEDEDMLRTALYRCCTVAESLAEVGPLCLSRAVCDTPGGAAYFAALLSAAGSAAGRIDDDAAHAASESASIVAQCDPRCGTLLVAAGTADTVTAACRSFVSRAPRDTTSREMCVNTWDVACALLSCDGARAAFLEAGLAEACAHAMRSGSRTLRRMGLRALDFALEAPSGGAEAVAAARWARRAVDDLMLRSVFPVLMGRATAAAAADEGDPSAGGDAAAPGRKRKRRAVAPEEEDVERAVSVAASLLTVIPPTSSRFERVLRKFDDDEKAERLAELHVDYAARVKAETDRQGGTSADPDAAFLDLLDAGLHTLRRLCVVEGFLLTLAGDARAAAMQSALTDEGVSVAGSIVPVLTDTLNAIEPDAPLRPVLADITQNLEGQQA